jgi:hypothetical protein
VTILLEELSFLEIGEAYYILQQVSDSILLVPQCPFETDKF